MVNRPKFFYGYIVVLVAFWIMAIIWGAYNSFGVFFNPVLTEFRWTRAATSGAFSLSFLLQGFLAIVMGRLTDRFGPRLVMASSSLFLGAGYILMSQLNSMWQLYLFYGLIVGIGMGGAFVPLNSTVARWFVKRRGAMTGVVVAGIGAGTIIGPPVATRLVSIWGWRTSYAIVGIAALVLIILAAQFLRRDPNETGQLPFGADEVKTNRPRLKDFSFQEAARTRQFWTVLAMLLCYGFSSFTIMVHLVPHAIELGNSPATGAAILATIGGLSIVGKVAMGSAIDRIGARLTFMIGFVLMAAALLWLVPSNDLWMLYLFAIAFGFAYGSIGTSESPIVAELFGVSSHGIILGVVTFGFTSGAAIGPFLAGKIFDNRGSYDLAFLVGAIACFVGLLLAILLRPTRRETNNPMSLTDGQGQSIKNGTDFKRRIGRNNRMARS